MAWGDLSEFESRKNISRRVGRSLCLAEKGGRFAIDVFGGEGFRTEGRSGSQPSSFKVMAIPVKKNETWYLMQEKKMHIHFAASTPLRKIFEAGC